MQKNLKLKKFSYKFFLSFSIIKGLKYEEKEEKKKIAA